MITAQQRHQFWSWVLAAMLMAILAFGVAALVNGGNPTTVSHPATATASAEQTPTETPTETPTPVRHHRHHKQQS